MESALAVATAPPYGAFTQLIALPNLTWEGRQCNAIKIANGSGPGRTAVYFLGGVHAREWGSCDILINFIEQLEQAYVSNTSLTFGAKVFSAADIKTIVDTLDIIVFPQANPDGRSYSMSTEPDWRKNRRTDAPNSAACPGVDVNRNFDFLWNYPVHFNNAAGVANSIDPCDAPDPNNGTYIGPSPFSEPESANAKWIFDNFLNVRYFMDLHSFGEDILYTWGDDENQTVDPLMNFQNPAFDGLRGIKGDAYKEYIPSSDLPTILGLATEFEKGIEAFRGRAYTIKPSYDLYPTAGVSDDYAYSRHLVDSTKEKIISYCVEWGSDANPTPFHPPYGEMQNIIQEITSGLLAFCFNICEREDTMAWQINGNTATLPNINFLGTTDAEPLVIKTGGLERTRVTPTGDVGIGTAAPRAKLEVTGGAILSGVVAGADVPGINYPYEYETVGVANIGYNLRLQSPNAIIFHTGNPPTEKLTITPAGNLGVGTSQPSARLSLVAPGTVQLAGTAASATLLTSAGGLGTAAGSELTLATIGYLSTGNNCSLGIRALRVANGTGWPSTAIGLGMDVDNTPRAGATLWLHANGNVGIGTTTPRAKLEVSPGAILNGIAIGADVSGINYPYEYETVGVAAPGFNLRLQSPNSIFFHTGNPPLEKLAITPAGNLGVGTSQPGARLSVAAPGAPQLTGIARSATLLTSAGSLGTAAGSDLALATIGFMCGNNSSLGVRALRVANGTDWPSTAIGLGMDVDDTVRAGAALWLHANGSVGIGSPAPRAQGGKVGVNGNSTDSYALLAENNGGGGAVSGISHGSLYPSVIGLAMSAGAGVQGHAAQTTKSSIGVMGTAGAPAPYLIDAQQTGGIGVVGHSGAGTGVAGASDGLGTIGNGVEGSVAAGSGAGVHGLANKATTVAIYAENSGGGQAGRFVGNVGVQGSLTTSGKAFRIDHPLDPTNQYLNHSSIECPDMMNVYNGNIVTDAQGEGVVGLPDYFEALNRDFKYQLTVIGEFAQAIVAREVEGNRFAIKTDRPNVKVSWQVTGVRKDPYAEAHRIRVEEKKSAAERGHYLHPELYPASPELGMEQPIGRIASTDPRRRPGATS